MAETGSVHVPEHRPAFYALATGGWRDYLTLLHPPYTAWHLAYVAIGAALAPALDLGRLWPALLAFFLAVGIGAHALDELHGRPLGTEIPSGLLGLLSGLSVGAAVGIGVWGAITVDPWLAAFVVGGAFVVVAYNLELLGMHSNLVFALAWGAFPLLAGYFAQAERLTWEALLGAAFAAALAHAQRLLSTQVRDVRRCVTRVEGRVERRDGTSQPLTAGSLIAREEGALLALAASVVLLAAALCIMRL